MPLSILCIFQYIGLVKIYLEAWYRKRGRGLETCRLKASQGACRRLSSVIRQSHEDNGDNG